MRKNRLAFISMVLIISFSILIIRLFNITIVQGERLRDQADNTRRKQINEIAARGKIYDRDGELLAGNRAVYNLNVYKDRFNRILSEEKNDVLKELVHILEEDGVSYLEDFFLGIYEYRYENDNQYFTRKNSPTAHMAELIQENKLLEEIVLAKEKIGKDLDVYYYPINRVFDYLDVRGKNLPISVTTQDSIQLDYIENAQYDNMLSQAVIEEGDSPWKLLMDTIEDDTSLIYHLLNHPLSRKIVYDITREKGIKTDIVLTDISFLSDLSFIENKASLSRLSDRISLTSEPKDDFLALVEDNTLDYLLQMMAIDEDKQAKVPVEILINQLNAIGIETEVTYELDPTSQRVNIKYSDGKRRSETPLDYLIRLGKEHRLVEDFILNPDVVSFAEQSLFDNSIYPRISRNSWQYIFDVEKSDVLEANRADENITAEELLDIYIQRYNLEEHDLYEAFGIISVYNKINAQGYFAYAPVTLAKNISERTLVEVEEKLPKDLGFEIVVEPNRYYPNREVFAHGLGYLGRISEGFEVKEYIEHREYTSEDVIGKTGLEESFEDTLRGTNGRTTVYTDVVGNTTDIIEQIQPVPGNNLHTTIDLKFQEDVEKILRDIVYAKANNEPYPSYYGTEQVMHTPGTQTAAAVVTDIKTGEILASASYPAYDPNMFVNGISSNDWEALAKEEDSSIYSAKPLLNLPIQGAMPPGSTYKTVISLAALEKGLDPQQHITCHGFVSLGDTNFNCLIYTNTGGTHGPINLYEALRVSCNYYYYALGLGENPKQLGQLDTKVTLSDVEAIGEKLGLNRPTGVEINIPMESRGHSPSLYGKRSLVRTMLRNYLNENITSYPVLIKNKMEEDYQNDIETILTWIESGPDMSRDQVIASLENMGYDPLTPPENSRVGLADMIKYTYLNQAVWTDSDSLNMVIGQGQNSYTPMQMALLAQTIASEGEQKQPTFVKKITNYDNVRTLYENQAETSQVDIAAEHFRHVKEGMRRAAESTSTHRKLPFEIGVKTGTAQSDSIDPKTGKKYQEFIWEIAFAPFDEPEIAVSLVIVQGARSRDAAVAVTDVIYSYYKHVKENPAYTNERAFNSQSNDQEKPDNRPIIEFNEQNHDPISDEAEVIEYGEDQADFNIYQQIDFENLDEPMDEEEILGDDND